MAFITNQKSAGSKKLGERLGELMGHADRLDMLVGFFFFSGVKVLYDALKARAGMKLRVLVGMEAEMAMGNLVESLRKEGDNSANAIKDRFFESMRKIVGSSEVDTKAFHDRLELFVEMLESQRLELRKTRDPNHAKLYIFTMDKETKTVREKIWITGSSNFSEPGLNLRDELNVEISDFGAEEAQKYFDDMWEKAVPLTATEEDRLKLIRMLRDASVAADVTPYEAYYLVLKQYLEYQKSSLNEERLDRLLKDAGFDKYRYQVDAVAQAMQKIEQYNGVIIADVVGLGKSIIASLIGAMRRRRGLIICPPGLMGDRSGLGGGWYEYKRKFKLNDWEICSRGKLDEVVEMLKVDNDFDMVVVDEAHNFRNEGTEDYGMLANICFGREVVLLTATPFNNRPNDLQALLKLFLPAKSSPLGDIEEQFRLYQKRYVELAKLHRLLLKPVPNWDDIHAAMKRVGGFEVLGAAWHDIKAAKAICAKKSKRLAGDVRQVMEKVVIRRNRIDLQNDPDYKDEIRNLSEVQPPCQQFFELSVEQNEFYDRVLNEYFGSDVHFKGAMYHPEDYLTDQEHDDAQRNIYLMLRNQLVQRFESSFGAFRRSVENVRRSMDVAKKFIARTGYYLYARKAMEKMLLIEDDADLYLAINEFVAEEEKKAKESGSKSRRRKTADDFKYRMNDPTFKGEEFQADLDADIELMDRLLKEIDDLELEKKDPKARKLVRVIDEVLKDENEAIPMEANSPRRKVLVFSAYADTISHIARYVEKKFPGKLIKITGGNFGPENARIVKRNFDASFETQEDDFDILLATDKLSEGFNLNRAGLVVNYDIPWNPTRVIQRVGRINRIGRRVFENLYIFNFFPTVKGSTIVNNREIAQAKMFAIHRILGEDAQIFSIEEEPTASALYDKLSKLDDDETTSFYTSTKCAFQKEKKFLEKAHPEVLERINAFPSMIKTAWESDKTQPHATFMFKRHGATFSVVVHSKNDNEISEWTLNDAVEQIKCSFDTPKEAFTEEFWQYPTYDKEKGGPRGVYESLKQYKPKGLAISGGTPDFVTAVGVIGMLRPLLESDLKIFGSMVAEDIQTYGTIPLRTIRQIAHCDRIKDQEKAAAELADILEQLRELRGDDYLEPIRRRAAAEAILVTIEKH